LLLAIASISSSLSCFVACIQIRNVFPAIFLPLQNCETTVFLLFDMFVQYTYIYRAKPLPVTEEIFTPATSFICGNN